MVGSPEKDATVGIIADWLDKALATNNKLKAAKESGKGDVISDSWVATDELIKTNWLLGLFQIFLIIIFGICGGNALVPGSCMM